MVPVNNNCETKLAKIRPWDEGTPRITCPHIFGTKAGASTVFPITALGERPLKFTAEGLPEGLTLNENTGVISGKTKKEADGIVKITVQNGIGADSIKLRIIAGDNIALTPPLGWNSWNCFALKVSDDKVRKAADAMVSSGLAAHGFTYINIDDGWQGERGGEFNAIQANKKFPDMERLCDYVHSLGLRIGIYSTPWVKSYGNGNGCSDGECERYFDKRNLDRGWYFGKNKYMKGEALQWAKWGFDYLKYDWHPWEVRDVKEMHDALKESGRDIAYSLSNSAPFQDAVQWAGLANCWRTTGDITDTWESMSRIGFSQDRWTPYSMPGHWNDPDMLVVGKLGWGDVRENRLTHDEQVTHITLWALLAAPLLIGCDLTQLDDFTLRLLCNDEVLSISQDMLGRQAHCLREIRETDDDGNVVHHSSVYVRKLYSGNIAVGLFNRSEKSDTVSFTWKDLKINGRKRLRNVWANEDIGNFDKEFAIGVPAHGAQFILINM
ncbi:MAG: glycoside hydrolase family 27 protein [Clostridiales bacterium]|nr:glycoside hydrolase family 27 protein [Clostridiales bacterium]HBM81920.1 alpha-galactosidase [Clostridiaceae bacterium]